MKRSRFSEEQIIGILKEHEAALGTATEMKAMKNYAGHRLSPWLGHLMVSRSETARPLLTPGEVMQLPPSDEIVMVAGSPPIRAKKARGSPSGRLLHQCANSATVDEYRSRLGASP